MFIPFISLYAAMVYPVENVFVKRPLSNSSVAPPPTGVGLPPNAIAVDDGEPPSGLPKLYLAVPKSAISVQLVPFQDSVSPNKPGELGVPPKAKADVCVPAPPNFCRPVFKSLTSVQLVPFQDCVGA